MNEECSCPFEELPEQLVEKSIRSYKHDESASINEKILINKWIHEQENEPFSIDVFKNEKNIECSYNVNSKVYSSFIPKSYTNVEVDMPTVGKIQFDTIDLIAVSIRNGFPWTNEAYYAFYIGKINENSLSSTQEFLNKYQILEQYHSPRKITGKPPNCTVKSNAETKHNDFLVLDIRNATHCKTPNPWSYASFGVLYENEELARKLFEHDKIYGNTEDYCLTPPNKIKQPHIQLYE